MCCSDTEKGARKILILKVEAEHISVEIMKNVEEFAEEIENSEPYVYRMKKTDNKRCIFLKNNLCSIYHIRPLICRFYPFQLKNIGNSRYVFIHTSECQGIGKGLQLKRGYFEKLFKKSIRMMKKNAKIV